MFNLLRKDKLGLALASGGAKGIAHISALEYLDRHNVKIEAIAGSSIGAIIGAMYWLKTLHDWKSELLSFTWRDLLRHIDPVFPKSGIVAGDKVVKYLSKFIDPDITFKDLPGKLAVLATDYHTGAAVVIREGSVLKAIRASISIPGVFVPFWHEGKLLIDGGVACPIPVNVLKSMGCQKVFAVNLHPHAQKDKVMFHKEKKMLELGDRINVTSKINAEGWFKFFAKSFSPNTVTKKEQPNMPSIIDVFMQSMETMEYMTSTLLLKHYKPHVLLEPDVRKINGLDFDKTLEVLTIAEAEIARKERYLKRKTRRWWR